MTKYEVMFVLDPMLDEAKKESTIELVKSTIEADGAVTNVDIWGQRKLAYPIEKKTEGYYVVVEFDGNSTLPKELDRKLKISDAVMRHIVVCKDEK